MSTRQNLRDDRSRLLATANETETANCIKKPATGSRLNFPEQKQQPNRSKSSSGCPKVAITASLHPEIKFSNTKPPQASDINKADQLRSVLSVKETRIQELQRQLEDRLRSNKAMAGQLANNRRRTRQTVEQEMKALTKHLEAGDLSARDMKKVVKTSDELVLILMEENDQLNELITQKVRDVNMLQQQINSLEQRANSGKEKDQLNKIPAHGLLELENKLHTMSMENELLILEKMKLEELNQRLQVFSESLVQELQSPEALAHAGELGLGQIYELEQKLGLLEHKNAQLRDSLNQKEVLIATLMNKIPNSIKGSLVRQTLNPNSNIDKIIGNNNNYAEPQEKRDQAPLLNNSRALATGILSSLNQISGLKPPTSGSNIQNETKPDTETWRQQGSKSHHSSARSTNRYYNYSRKNSRTDLEKAVRDSEENPNYNEISKSYEQESSLFRSTPFSQAEKASANTRHDRSVQHGYRFGRDSSDRINIGTERAEEFDIIHQTQNTLPESEQGGLTYEDESRSDRLQRVNRSEKERRNLNSQEFNSKGISHSKFIALEASQMPSNSQFQVKGDSNTDSLTTNKNAPRRENKEKADNREQEYKKPSYQQEKFNSINPHLDLQAPSSTFNIQANQNFIKQRESSPHQSYYKSIETEQEPINPSETQNNPQSQAQYVASYIPRSKYDSSKMRAPQSLISNKEILLGTDHREANNNKEAEPTNSRSPRNSSPARVLNQLPKQPGVSLAPGQLQINLTSDSIPAEQSQIYNVLQVRNEPHTNSQPRYARAPVHQQKEPYRIQSTNPQVQANSSYQSQNSYIPKSQYLKEKLQVRNDENTAQGGISFQNLVGNAKITENLQSKQNLPLKAQKNNQNAILARFDVRMGAENVEFESESGIEKTGPSQIKSNRLAGQSWRVPIQEQSAPLGVGQDMNPKSDLMQTGRASSLNQQPKKIDFGALFKRSEQINQSNVKTLPLKNLKNQNFQGVENQQTGRTITFGPSLENSPRVEFPMLEKDHDSQLLRTLLQNQFEQSNSQRIIAEKKSETPKLASESFDNTKNSLPDKSDNPPISELNLQQRDSIQHRKYDIPLQINERESLANNKEPKAEALISSAKRFEQLRKKRSQDLEQEGNTEPLSLENHADAINQENFMDETTIALNEVQDLAGLCDKLREENQRLKDLIEKSEDTIKNYCDVYSTFESKSKEQMQEIKKEYEDLLEFQDQKLNELKTRVEEASLLESH